MKVLVTVLRHGFGVVAGFTQRLPVAAIPKEDGVAPVRHDVIHDRRRGRAAFLQAAYTQRMLPQVDGSRPLPPLPIALLSSRFDIMRMGWGMVGAVAGAIGDQLRAAWMLAGRVRPARHGGHLLAPSVPNAGKDGSGVRAKKKDAGMVPAPYAPSQYEEYHKNSAKSVYT